MGRRFKDMMGRDVVVPDSPRRIISVVPSQTELLYDLGLGDEVVGITKFCVHPERWFRSKNRVGGTKNLSIDRIRALKPDLIIANKEENERGQIEELATLFPVWVSDIHTLEDAITMIQAVGELTNTQHKAIEIGNTIDRAFQELARSVNRKKVAYFIWYRPWMAAGGDTFINDILQRIGWHNALSETMRYPEVTLEYLRSLNPELILLSSEPYPFKNEHVMEVQAAFPEAGVKLVDGEMFSWYGSRLLHSAAYLKGLFAGL